MPKQLKIFPEKCIGCKSCELACSLKNEGEMNPGKSRITMLFFHEGTYPLPYCLPLTCRQCADAPCLASCPVDAISRLKNVSKTVVIDGEACIKCGRCVSACPFGAMYFNAEERLPYKCELCGGDPACVSLCPTGAIAFIAQKPYYAKAETLHMKGYALLSGQAVDNVKAPKTKE
jgi:anaerobic carbon-monoxide dehydrogenase iron sulfur subunit